MIGVDARVAGLGFGAPEIGQPAFDLRDLSGGDALFLFGGLGGLVDELAGDLGQAGLLLEEHLGPRLGLSTSVGVDQGLDLSLRLGLRIGEGIFHGLGDVDEVGLDLAPPEDVVELLDVHRRAEQADVGLVFRDDLGRVTHDGFASACSACKYDNTVAARPVRRQTTRPAEA